MGSIPTRALPANKPLSQFTVQNWQSDSGLPQNTVNAILQTQDGFLWIGTDGGLARFDGYTFRVFDSSNTPAMRSDSVRTLSVDGTGALILVTAEGTLRYRDGIFSASGHAVAPGDASAASDILSVTSGGAKWTGSIQGLSVTRGPKTRSILANERITALFANREGSVWASTSRGLVRISPDGGIERLERSDLTSAHALFEDREGNLWIGTESAGLTILRDAAVTTIAGAGGLGTVRTLVQDSSGTIWLGQNGGLSRIGPDGTAEPASPAIHAQVLALAAGREVLWIGTSAGLVRRDAAGSRVFTTADGLADDFVRSLFSDPDGSLWIGTRHGLSHFLNGKFVNFSRMDGLASDFIGSILRDRDGTLWVGTLAGLDSMAGDHFAPAANVAVAAVTSLYADAGGELWVGMQKLGMTRLRGTDVTTFAPNSGMPEIIYSILGDDSGHLWLNTRHGIVRVALNDLKQNAQIPTRAFSTSEASTGGHPSAWRMRDGSLWFATLRGVARVAPQDADRATTRPLTVIESVELDDRAVPLTGGDDHVDIPPGAHRLAIHYAGLSFAAPSQVTYRYTLRGVDRGWVQAGTRREADYTNISPGRYNFAVYSANPDGEWSERAAELGIVAQPHYFQTLWFYFALAVFFLLLAAAAYLWRASYVESRHQAVLDERLRIAREIHDTLAQGYVAVAVQLEVAQRLLRTSQDAATEQLQATRQLVRDGLEQARNSIWNLRSQTDAKTLPSRLTTLVEVHTGDGSPQVAFKVHGQYRPLPADYEDCVVRVCEEALNNATRHAAATQIAVQLSYDASMVCLEVRDNGRGLPAEEQRARGRFGIVGMRERAAKLHGSLRIETAPGAGTSVVLELPIEKGPA